MGFGLNPVSIDYRDAKGKKMRAHRQTYSDAILFGVENLGSYTIERIVTPISSFDPEQCRQAIIAASDAAIALADARAQRRDRREQTEALEALPGYGSF